MNHINHAGFVVCRYECRRRNNNQNGSSLSQFVTVANCLLFSHTGSVGCRCFGTRLSLHFWQFWSDVTSCQALLEDLNAVWTFCKEQSLHELILSFRLQETPEWGQFLTLFLNQLATRNDLAIILRVKVTALFNFSFYKLYVWRPLSELLKAKGKVSYFIMQP